jgi:hypothetical protein
MLNELTGIFEAVGVAGINDPADPQELAEVDGEVVVVPVLKPA